MKKKVVRVLAVTGILAALSLGFAGCKKKVECDICGLVNNCQQVEYLGEKMYVCDSCKAGIDMLGNLLG